MNNIIIEIGDWSGDGHGQKETYVFDSNLTTEEVRESYFSAKEKYPSLCPEDFCCEYEDSEVPKQIVNEAQKLGFKINKASFGTKEMANYTAWFCQLGNPNLKLKMQKQKHMPTLAFYGVDKKKRHINFIGYGLLGN